jgi:hypothetical protein
VIVRVDGAPVRGGAISTCGEGASIVPDASNHWVLEQEVEEPWLLDDEVTCKDGSRLIWAHPYNYYVAAPAR